MSSYLHISGFICALTQASIFPVSNPKAFLIVLHINCLSARLSLTLRKCLVPKLFWLIPHQHECLSKDYTKRHARVNGGKPTRPKPYPKNHRQTKESWELETQSYSGESTPINYSLPNGQPCKHTYTWVAYTSMYATATNEEKGQGFEKEQRAP